MACGDWGPIRVGPHPHSLPLSSPDNAPRQARFRDLDDDGSGELMLAELKELLIGIEAKLKANTVYVCLLPYMDI